MAGKINIEDANGWKVGITVPAGTADRDIVATDQTITYTKTETDTEISNRITGFKNGIINPSFEINQYADIDTAPVGMVNNSYQIDRFLSYIFGGVTGTIQRLPKSLINGKYVHSVKCIATSTATSSMGLIQKVEVFYNGETKTYGAWVKSNSTEARVWTSDGVTNTSSTAHSGSGAYEFLNFSKDINLGASKQWFYVAIMGVTGANVPITTGDYIESTMWQLEDGDKATKFEQRPVGLELSLCKRYAEDLYYKRIVSFAYTTNAIYFSVPLGFIRDGIGTLFSGIEGTDWSVWAHLNLVAHTGFVLNLSGVYQGSALITATKTSHGLATATLSFGTKSKNIIQVEI